MVVKNQLKDRKIYLLFFSVFATSFLIYLRTLAPTVLSGDSAEAQYISYVTGIAHTPGYPLYTILGKLFTFLPIGNVAFRINLMSAFFASLTVAIIYLSIQLLTAKHTPAVISALLLSVSRIFWSQAVSANVYTLDTFLLAGLIFSILYWHKNKDSRYLYLFSFIYGLTLTHRVTLFLTTLPAVAYFVVITGRERKFSWRQAANSTLFFLLGFTPFIYIYIADKVNHPASYFNLDLYANYISYGFSKKQISSFLFRFIWLTTALHEARTQFFKLPLGEMARKLDVYVTVLLSHQFTFIGFSFGIIGIWENFKKRREIFVLLFLSFLGLLAFPLVVDNPKFAIFCLPTFVIFSVWIGFFLAEAFEFLSNGSQVAGSEISMAPQSHLLNQKMEPQNLLGRRSQVILLSLLLFILAAYLYSINYVDVDQSRNYAAYYEGKYIFDQVRQDAIILSQWGPINTLLYLKYVEKMRPDVKIMRPANSDLVITKNDWKRPIYFVSLPTNLSAIAMKYRFVARGKNLYQILPRK